jgi:hypothetical protein
MHVANHAFLRRDVRPSLHRDYFRAGRVDDPNVDVRGERQKQALPNDQKRHVESAGHGLASLCSTFGVVSAGNATLGGLALCWETVSVSEREVCHSYITRGNC